MRYLTLLSLLLIVVISSSSRLFSQIAECPYPVILLHGWTGDQTSFIDTYTDTDFENAFGTLAESQVFYTMNNATTSTYLWGGAGSNDDDVLVSFSNENNLLPPACVYALNQDNSISFSGGVPVLLKNNGNAISFTESDSNESALYKQGYTLKSMIEAVLAANPGKDKVVVVGHSMGGLAIREYLQRTESGSMKWWVNPGNPDGHQIIKAMTIVTPHGGSNTLGNIGGIRGENPNGRDGLPDYFSEGVRDLRYSWACGFLGLSSCPAAYLYGGDEDAGFGWWNEDINCDGDESDSNIIGLNIDGTDQGFGEIWHGTYDNPNMPLPTNLRYTYLTSDIIGFDGDGVVAMNRQWPHDASIPQPSDGVAGRLSDTLLTNVFHTDANDDADVVVRGIDEGDYPAFVWDINTEIDYINLCNFRATNVPEGLSSQDPDWYRFIIPAGFTSDIEIEITPNSGISTRLDFFGSTAAAYTSINTNSTQNLVLPQGSNSLSSLIITNSALTIGGENYFRLLHSSVNTTDWRQPLIVAVKSMTPLPVVWSSISAQLIDKTTSRVYWSTEAEENLSHYEIEYSIDGVHFAKIGNQPALTQKDYTFSHQDIPLGKCFYRIKAIDFDGLISFSPIVDVMNTPSSWTIRNFYPVPADNFVELNIFTPTNILINLKFFNTHGKELQRYSKNLMTGDNYLNINISDLPSGIYLLLIENKGEQSWQRLVKR